MSIAPRQDLLLQLLEFFYPIHYKVGMALEDRLGAGRISRKQVTMLWLIRSEGEQGRRLSRKRIEQLLSGWFEVSSSAITKSLRTMAQPSMGLVRLVEDPHSGREKQVWLTAKGERFVASMVDRGREFIGTFARHFTADEIEQAIAFFSRVADFINGDSVKPFKARTGSAVDSPAADPRRGSATGRHG
ncbi:MAG: MarR family winged helix-turn-helix transcriptional regulator [Candidatus Binataceae bacterium]